MDYKIAFVQRQHYLLAAVNGTDGGFESGGNASRRLEKNGGEGGERRERASRVGNSPLCFALKRRMAHKTEIFNRLAEDLGLHMFDKYLGNRASWAISNAGKR